MAFATAWQKDVHWGFLEALLSSFRSCCDASSVWWVDCASWWCVGVSSVLVTGEICSSFLWASNRLSSVWWLVSSLVSSVSASTPGVWNYLIWHDCFEFWYCDFFTLNRVAALSNSMVTVTLIKDSHWQFNLACLDKLIKTGYYSMSLDCGSESFFSLLSGLPKSETLLAHISVFGVYWLLTVI